MVFTSTRMPGSVSISGRELREKLRGGVLLAGDEVGQV